MENQTHKQEISFYSRRLMEMPRTKRMRRCSNRKTNLMDLDNLVDIFSRLPEKSVCSVGLPQLVIVSQSGKKYTEDLISMQSFEYDGNTLKMTSRPTTRIVSEILSRWYELSFQLHFVFCNLGEAAMLPTCITQTPEHLNLKITAFSAYWYGMGFDNTTCTHKIVRVCGDISWREMSSVPSYKLTDKSLSAYGDMHWLIRRATTGGVQANICHWISILSFDFKREEFGWNIPDHPPPPPPPGRSLRIMPHKSPLVQRFQLINLRGSLSIVDASSDRYLDIWMLKNYDEKEMFNNAEYPYRRSFGLWNWGEWEHGIFFKRSRNSSSVVVFLYLRTGNINPLSGGLLSLKNYGNLIPLKRYGKPDEAEAEADRWSCNPFFNIWHNFY
ncbi:unnamed protein product [Malus baccata var. baccata]